MNVEADAAASEAGTAADDLRATVAAEADATEGQQGNQTDDTASPDPDAAPEEREFRFGAKTYRIAKDALPEDIAAGLDEFTRGIQGDYTRKTQEVAETRKSLEAAAALAQSVTKLQGEALAAYSHGQRLSADIKQLRAVDLDTLWQSDPDRARRVSDMLASKEAEFNQTVRLVAQHEAAREEAEQRHIATLEQSGRAAVTKAIPGFDGAAEEKLIRYAVSQGVSEAEAKAWPRSPKVAEWAWKAMQFDELTAKSRSAGTPAPGAAPPPVRPVSGRSAPAAKDPERMSTDEWMRHRKAEIAKSRG